MKLLRSFGLTVMLIEHKPGVLVVRLDGPVHYTESSEGLESPLVTPIPSLPLELCDKFPLFREDSRHLPKAAIAWVRQCIEDMGQAFNSMAQTQRALGPSLYGSSLDYQDQARDAQEELRRASDDQSKWSCSVTFALHCSQVGRATLFIVLRL